MGDYPFFWNLALPNQYLGRNLGPRNPFNGKRHRQSKETSNTATLQPFSSPLSSLYVTSLKLFNVNHRKRVHALCVRQSAKIMSITLSGNLHELIYSQIDILFSYFPQLFLLTAINDFLLFIYVLTSMHQCCTY